MDFIWRNFILFSSAPLWNIAGIPSCLRKVLVLTTNHQHEIASCIKTGTMKNRTEGDCNPLFFCWSLSIFSFDYLVSQATFFTALKQTKKKDFCQTMFLHVPLEKNLYILYIFTHRFPLNIKITAKTVIIQQYLCEMERCHLNIHKMFVYSHNYQRENLKKILVASQVVWSYK